MRYTPGLLILCKIFLKIRLTNFSKKLFNFWIEIENLCKYLEFATTLVPSVLVSLTDLSHYILVVRDSTLVSRKSRRSTGVRYSEPKEFGITGLDVLM